MATYAKSPAPKLVKQDTSKFHCWAASLESWIDCAKPGTPQAAMTKTQAELIASYKQFTGTKDALLVTKALFQVMFDFQMMASVFYPGSQANGHSIALRLMTKGYLWMFYFGGGLGTNLGHAEVVYGVVNSHSQDAQIRTMDPWTGTLELRPVADLRTRSQVYMCWKENSPTWSDDMFKIMKMMLKVNGGS